MSEAETAEIEAIKEEEVIEETPEETEVDTEAVEEAEPEEAEEEGEFIVTIGEEAPPQEDDKKAPEWVRELRKAHTETKKENRELQERLASYEKKPDITLGPKPVASDFEYDYDKDKSAEEQYAEKLDEWYVKKEQVAEQEKEVKAKETEQQKAWKSTLGAYEEKKAVIKAKALGFDEAEALVKDSLSVVYQGAILSGSDNPALLILALGKNPAKLKELSSIEDPSKFIFAVAKMETQLKTSNRKAVTTPEKKVVGSGSGANSTDATLAKLEAEAEKTGDRSKILDYKRKQKQT
jgi:hypothetical protein